MTPVDRWLARSETLLVVVALSVLVRVLYVYGPTDVLAPNDPWVLGRSLWHGAVPYRDFPFEYPPGALLAFLIPGAVPRAWGDNVLALQSFAVEATALLALRHHPLAVRRYLLASLFAVPLLAGGFDALAVAAVAWSTVLLVRGDRRGWWVAAAGTAIKLFPGVAWGWTRRRTVAAGVSLAAAVAVILAPLLVADADRTPIGYHLHRGVQNESVAASLTFLWHTLRGAPNTYAYRFGANELVGAGPASAVTLIAFGALAVAVALACHRRPAPVTTALPALALLSLVLCGSKVLSPQFLALLGPLVAVVGGWYLVAFLPISFLTLAAFLTDNPQSDGFVAVATVRNVLLVGLAVAAARAVLRTSDPVGGARPLGRVGGNRSTTTSQGSDPA